MAHSSRRCSWFSSLFCLEKWFHLEARQAQRPRQPVQLGLEVLEERTLLAAPTFTPLSSPAPDTTGEMMLLTNGTVMAQANPGNNIGNVWYSLTPDAQGNYVNGTWGNLASMSVQRLFFGSAVMPSGKVFVVGGEYASDKAFSNTAEIYDPASDSWSNASTFPHTAFGDDPATMLPSGKILLGYVSGPQTYLYDPASDSYTPTGTRLYNDQSDEEAWVKLADGSILTYDIFSSMTSGTFQAQRYVPATGTWVDASNTTGGGLNGTTLSTTGLGYELGPAFLLPNGKVLQLGATNHTAIYDPTANSWSRGPDVPGGFGADDAPGAVLSDGQVVFEADQGPSSTTFAPPAGIFDYDYNTNTITNITSTLPGPLQTFLNGSPAYFGRMVTLPNGQTLYGEGDNQLYAITPAGTPQAAWRPTITAVTGPVAGAYTLTGTQINGINEGSGYGDDVMEASNYPIVQLTSGAGTVYDATSFNWTSVVATGATPETTQFSLPAGIPDGTYSLTVSANGISSAALLVNISGGTLSTGPHLTTTGGVTLNYFVSQAPAPIDVGVSVTDPGSANLTGATVAITTGYVNGQDVLGFTNQNGIKGTFSAGVLTLTGSSSVANYQAALESVTYTDINAFATAGARTVTFTAKDALASSSGTDKIVLTISNPIVGPAALAAGKVAVNFSQTITATNGIAPFTFSITVGALPAGLTLDSVTGILSGTPTAGGTFRFTVSALDSSGGTGPHAGNKAYVLTIAAPTLLLTPTSLPSAKVGGAYSQSITASGGTPSFTYSTLSTLPAGMTLDTIAGTLSGTPTAGGSFNIVLLATDSSTGTGPYSISRTYTLTVNAPTIAFTPSSVPADKVGTPYSATLSVSGGTAAYSNITIVSGALPTGLLLDGTTGIISGTPTAAGTFHFTASVTDSSTGTGPYTSTQPYILAITQPTLTFTPSSLPATQTGVSYSATIGLSGGTAPYTFALSGGALPTGMSLASATGTISGVPTAGGTFNFTITGTDSTTGTGPFSATKTYSIAVNAPTITFTPTILLGAQVGVGFSQPLAVSGGIAPYTFAIATGALPAGLAIDFRSGTISGTPKAGGLFGFTVQATDSSGGTGPFSQTQSYSLNVAAPTLVFAPTSVPPTVVGAVYNQPVAVTGGTPRYTYVLAAGALPTGLTLNAATGAIGGEPTAGGPFNFTIKATDSSGGTGPYSATQSYALNVAPPTITFTPTTLASAPVGVAYNVALTPTGGTAPYTSIQMTSGALPAGMAFSAAGILSGTPTAGGTFTFTVAATDSSTGTGPYSGSQTYTLNVTPPTLVFTPAMLSAVQVGVPFSQSIGVSGGTAPYSSIRIGSGTLPAGVTMSSGGVLSGTPTAGGTFNFTVMATDSSTGTGPFTESQNFSVTVKAPVLAFSPLSLAGAQVGAAYNQTVTASGGTAPFTNYAVTAGVLPAGLSLNASTGVLSGKPTAGGSFPITISATDSSTGTGPYTQGAAYTLFVAPPVLALSPAVVIGGEVGVAYNQSLTASGGTGPYFYTVSAGTLPAGLSLSPAGVLSGTPTKTGTLGFTIKATDSSTGAGPYSVFLSYTQVIYSRIAITTATLPTYWAVNMPGYRQTIATTGGAPGVTFSVSAGSLPHGLSLDPNTGILSGTPTGVPDGIGNFNFDIAATDSVGATATQFYTVTINPPDFVYDPATKTLTIGGTNFMFTQATTADAQGTHTSYTFAMDSFSETLPSTVVSSVIVTGAVAGAKATLVTTDTYIGTDGLSHETPEVAVLGNGGGQLLKTNAAGNNFTFLQLNNFSSTYAYLGRADSGRLNATAGVSNILVTAGSYSYLTSPTSFALINGGAYVYGYAAGPTDQAWQYDGSGPSTFVASGTAYSTMSGTDKGQSFYNEAIGFTVNYGIALHAGQDVAYILDSSLNDNFVGNVGVSYMYADNSSGGLAEFDEAEGFATVYAYAFVGGTNTAYNHDPSQVITAGWLVGAGT